MPTPKTWYGEAERLHRYSEPAAHVWFGDHGVATGGNVCYDDNGDRLHDMLCNRSDAECRSSAPLDLEALRIEQKWPTPHHMRAAADALDVLATPNYGDVLRWVADACDGND